MYQYFDFHFPCNFIQRTDKNNQQWWMDAVEFITQDDDDDTGITIISYRLT